MSLPSNGTIRVVEFSTEEWPKASGSGPPLFTFQEFHTLRNEVLSILSTYGTFGPNGKLRVEESVEESVDIWSGDATRHPDFYVVSDIWNFRSRWIRIESSTNLIRQPLLEELCMTLFPLPNWCFYLALGNGGLTVFADRILFEGEVFSGCCSVNDLYQRCAR
jgi:hypothetical protein